MIQESTIKYTLMKVSMILQRNSLDIICYFYIMFGTVHNDLLIM